MNAILNFNNSIEIKVNAQVLEEEAKAKAVAAAEELSQQAEAREIRSVPISPKKAVQHKIATAEIRINVQQTGASFNTHNQPMSTAN